MGRDVYGTKQKRLEKEKRYIGKKRKRCMYGRTREIVYVLKDTKAYTMC